MGPLLEWPDLRGWIAAFFASDSVPSQTLRLFIFMCVVSAVTALASTLGVKDDTETE